MKQVKGTKGSMSLTPPAAITTPAADDFIKGVTAPLPAAAKAKTPQAKAKPKAETKPAAVKTAQPKPPDKAAAKAEKKPAAVKQAPAPKVKTAKSFSLEDFVSPAAATDSDVTRRFNVDMPLSLRRRIKQASLDHNISMNTLIVNVLAKVFG